MPQLGDFLKSINLTKEDLLEHDEDGMLEKEYLPYVTNRCLSYFADCIMFANEMNRRHTLPKKLQYHFLLNIIRKRKRFKKWDKFDDPDALKVVKEYYGYNNDRAKEALAILSTTDIEYIRTKLEKGGRK